MAWLLESLKGMGYSPAVIARGYGSAAVGEANDEAQMLNGAVYCHPQRRIAAKAAIQNGADYLIMDDGFQHRQLHRDTDLLCIDATRPWGWQHNRFGAFLPFGILREHGHALRRCHGDHYPRPGPKGVHKSYHRPVQKASFTRLAL